MSEMTVRKEKFTNLNTVVELSTVYSKMRRENVCREEILDGVEEQRKEKVTRLGNLTHTQ